MTFFTGQGLNPPLRLANSPQSWGGNSDLEFAVLAAMGKFSGGIIGGSLRMVQIFGRNTSVAAGTAEDLWLPGGTHAFNTTAQVLEVVSDDADDAAGDTGAQTVRVWGLDADGEELFEDVTLNGTTAVDLVNEFLAVNGMIVLTAGSSGANEGTITLQLDGAGAVQTQIGPLRGRAESAIFTVPDDHVLVVINGKFGAELFTTFNQPAIMSIESRANASAAWLQDVRTLMSAGSRDVPILAPPYAYPAGTQIRARFLDASASTAALGVSCQLTAALIATHNTTRRP